MLPFPKITKLPTNPRPMAEPATWNTRYEEIDTNFENVDARVESLESEIETYEPLPQHVEDLQADFDAIQVELAKLKRVSGTATIHNRGVQAGGKIIKSTSAVRNVRVARSIVFLGGALYHLRGTGDAGLALIPPNPNGQQATAIVYLYVDENEVPQVDCTNLNEDPPEDSLPLYRAEIPAGNDESEDQFLAQVDLISIHRMEPGWPMIQQAAVEFHPQFLGQIDEPYQFHFEVLTPSAQKADFVVERVETNINGTPTTYVSLRYLGAFDSVEIRWTVRVVGEE